MLKKINKLISFSALFILSALTTVNAQDISLGNKSNLLSNNWESWHLLVVTMNAKKEPIQQASIDFSQPVKLNRKNGPTIEIEDYFYDNNSGKLLKVSCDNQVITQKFATTFQLKGWALEITCKKERYYFIVN